MAQIKVSQLSKDFNLKSKDISDLFKEIGLEKKNSGASVESDELEAFFSYITKKNQIKSLEAYTKGEVTITIADKAKPIPAAKTRMLSVR